MKGKVVRTGIFPCKPISPHAFPKGLTYSLDEYVIVILFFVHISASECSGLQFCSRTVMMFDSKLNIRIDVVFGICNLFIRFVRPQQVFDSLWVLCYCSNFLVEATLVLALCFDARRVCSAEVADLSMNKRKSDITGLSCTTLLSHATLKLHRNSIMKIRLKGLNLFCFICAVIPFDIFLILLETEHSSFNDLFCRRYVV